MERKRKASARTSRAESANKKRTATPPEHQSQTQAQAAPPPPVVEELPTRIAAGKPLPTTEDPQPENLPSNEFQSISESGVLAESLLRSRQKWLSEGIFEKYWTKPIKKKGGPPEPPNNPPKDSMTKLGSCTITVEPHIFDATMYAIKEPARPASQAPPPQSTFRPIIQYGPPNGVMPPPQVQPPPVPPKQSPIPQPTPKPTSTAQDTPIKTGTAGQPNTPTAAPAVTKGTPNTQPHNQPANSPPNPAPAPPAANKSTDPVIQMLAERAATDAELKALMRIVANGEATPEELKKFQNHIDELTRLSKARQAASQATSPTNTHPQPPSTTPANGQIKKENKVSTPAPVVKQAPPPPPPQPHYVQPQPQALRSKGPLPPSKPDISGIVFEFTGGSGDRFLFPKYSILEYLPGGQVIASFLIVRKGSSSDSPTYDRALDYYQPITIRLYTHQGRQLESLQKVVAPPDEVRRYMDDIMDNMTRAEYVLLAMRLPKENPEPSPEKEDEAMQIDPPETHIPVLWSSVNPARIPTPKLPPSKQRLLTEEEKYQSFINSVSSTV